jgi:hypothetical protein
MMSLYLMVRGPVAGLEFAKNWSGEVLTTLSPKQEILDKCIVAMGQNEWVFIHRVSEGYGSPMIVGKCKITKIENKTCHFDTWLDIDLKPTTRGGFKSFYIADPIEGGIDLENARGEAKPYSIRNEYVMDDILDHPKFGKGLVFEVKPEYVYASFPGHGKKRLVHNK